MENKNKGSKNKVILGNFNCIMDKMGIGGGNKLQRIYKCYQIMPCQNSLLTIGSRIYMEKKETRLL